MNTTLSRPLPHHSLTVFRRAQELLKLVVAARIQDAKLRDEALRAAKGTCLNIAEGAARSSKGDKARAYSIARAEAAEAAAAIEIAEMIGAASTAHAEEAHRLASEVFAMLTALIH